MLGVLLWLVSLVCLAYGLIIPAGIIFFIGCACIDTTQFKIY